jgi:hypothetical protein
MGKQESKAGASEVDAIISKLEKAGKGFDEAKVRCKNSLLLNTVGLAKQR